MTLPSQEYIASRIDYNPETGETRWKLVDESYGPTWKRFNKIHSGNLITNKDVCLEGTRFRVARIVYKLYYGKDPGDIVKFLDKDSKNFSILNLSVGRKAIPKEFAGLANSLKIPEDVADLLIYKHDTGKFYWLPREDKTFNTKWSGKESGYINPNGYCELNVHSKKYKAHRVAWYMYYGVDPATYLIDHIDGNKSNNSIKNLRLANHSLNRHAAASTIAKGWIKKDNRYLARLSINNIETQIGLYYTKSEAIAAYNAALERYKPMYQFTEEEQAQLDLLYATYPNADPSLQSACHDLQVKALNHYIDAAIVQRQM